MPAASRGTAGVVLASGGSVTNQSGGVISGFDGIFGETGALTVVNAGSIAGAGAGVDLLVASSSVTNQSGGSISGEVTGFAAWPAS